MSQRISIDLVRPGMHLAEDVVDATGRKLAARGETVGEALLTLAREVGIVTVSVVPGAASGAAGHERLDYLFRRCQGEAMSQVLLRVMREYREERPK